MHRQTHLGKPLEKSKNFGEKLDSGKMPAMKGNIGPTQNKVPESLLGYTNMQKKLFSKMAEEFDIDKVIPKNQQKLKASHDDIAYSDGSFKLSIKNEDIESLAHSQEHNTVFAAKGNNRNIIDIPGVSQALEEDSGLITSDSDFEMNQDLNEKDSQDDKMTQNPDHTSPRRTKPARKVVDIKKDVTKTFKKMLT